MGKRLRILLIVLATAVLGGLAWFALHTQEKEPVYEGRTLTAWLQNYKVPYADMNHADIEPAEWKQADTAVARIGTNAYPTLLRMFQACDPPWKSKLISLARKQHVIAIHHIPAVEQRMISRMAFNRLTRGGFTGMFGGSPRLTQAQADCLVPTLVAFYEHGADSELQMASVDLLHDIGPHAKAAVPALVRGATNTNSVSLRSISIWALAGIVGQPLKEGQGFSNPMRPMFPAAQRPPRPVSEDAQNVSAVIVPLLAKDLLDANRSTREVAVKALAQLPPDPASAGAVVSGLTKLITDNTGIPQFTMDVQYVPQALINYSADAKPAIPALLEFVRTQPRGYLFLILPAVDAIMRIDPETTERYKNQLDSAARGKGFN